MMYKKIITAVLPVLLILSCSENTEKKAAAAADSVTHHAPAMPPAPEKKFANVAFANEKDYICGMPVTAGVEDTAHYKEKVYGFCAKECKDEFLKNPEQYVTAKK